MKTFIQFLNEGAEEHEKFKDHTKNPYHKTLTQHGFQHQSTTHEHNPNHPSADSTIHRYTHPDHGRSHVVVDQEHDPTSGHGGMKSKGHGFHHRHEQSNGILAPSIGDSKNQLHKSLSRHYGVPKGMEAPKLTANEKKYPHIASKYKMNEVKAHPDSLTDHTKNPYHDTLTKHGFKHTGSSPGYYAGSAHHAYEHPDKGKAKATVYPKEHSFGETHWEHTRLKPDRYGDATKTSSGKSSRSLDAHMTNPEANNKGVHNMTY